MKETLAARLNKTELQEIFQEVAHNHPQVMYASGPLNKSVETKLFEEIVRDLLIDAREGNTNRVKLEVIESEVFFVRGEANINLNNLLSKVNFNHLNFSEQEISDYSQYIASDIYNSTPEKINQSIDNYYKHAPNSKEKESLKQLSYGEKQAIAIYTKENYKDINALLRGQILLKRKNMPYLITDALLHAAMAAHGLNKLPDVDLPRVVRIQDEYNLNKFIDNSNKHIVSQENAFISTTDKFSKESTKQFKGNVRIIYENVKGKKIAALSTIPEENEYLIPPSTQIKWTGHREENGVHYFTVQGTNVLIEQMYQIEEGVKEVICKIEKCVDNTIDLITEKKQTSASVFINSIVDIIADSKFTNENNIQEYKSNNESTHKNSNYKKDAQQFFSSIKNNFLPLKTKLYNLVGNIIAHLGIKSLGTYYSDKARDIQKKSIDEKITKKLDSSDLESSIKLR